MDARLDLRRATPTGRAPGGQVREGVFADVPAEQHQAKEGERGREAQQVRDRPAATSNATAKATMTTVIDRRCAVRTAGSLLLTLRDSCRPRD